MTLAYVDESGDDGLHFEGGSPPLLIISALHIPHKEWFSSLSTLTELRASWGERTGFPSSVEFHTKDFLLNKKPYRQYDIDDRTRLAMLEEMCTAIASCGFIATNVVVVKQAVPEHVQHSIMEIAVRTVLKASEGYFTERTECHSSVLMWDNGRIPQVKRLVRTLQGRGNAKLQVEHMHLPETCSRVVDDPVGKESRECLFIQASDVLTLLTYVYSAMIVLKSHEIQLHGRLRRLLNDELVERWMSILSGRFNITRLATDRYGIIYIDRKLAGEPL